MHCEDIAIPVLAEQYGTPLYVYSQGTLLHHLKSIQTAFAAVEPLICYSIKPNANIHLARLMIDHGAGCDVTSAGELFRAAQSRLPDPKKSPAGGQDRCGTQEWLDLNILFFNVESEGEPWHLVRWPKPSAKWPKLL